MFLSASPTRASCTLVFSLALASPSQGQTLTKSQVAKIGKAATALVEAKAGKASGSAFCIDATGLFITNEHVVRGEAGSVNLVLDSGTDSQKVLKAKVVRSDPELDLALLRVEDKVKLPPLTVGKDDQVAELMELVAFGFPFGKGLALEKGQYPAITVNVVNVTSLRKKDKELVRIQLDGALNPGHSGGPVLDKDGKVAGVVVSGLRGTGVSFAIPASQVARFLAQKDLRRLEGHKGIVYSVAFSPDGKTLASASADGTVKLWDWPDGRLRQTLVGGQGEMVFLGYSPDGKALVSTSRQRAVVSWDASTWEKRWAVLDHAGAVNAVVFSPDGKTLATAGDDKTVKLRNPDTGQVRSILRGHQRAAIALTFPSDGRTLISGGGEWGMPAAFGEVRVWDVEKGEQLSSVAGQFGGVWGLALSPDGKTLAGACLDRTVRLWDTATWKERAVLRGHADRVIWVAFSPKGDLLASSSHDKTVRLWNPADGKERGVLRGHAAAVDRLAFSRDGKFLASTSYDATIGLWEMPQPKP